MSLHLRTKVSLLLFKFSSHFSFFIFFFHFSIHSPACLYNATACCSHYITVSCKDACTRVNSSFLLSSHASTSCRRFFLRTLKRKNIAYQCNCLLASACAKCTHHFSSPPTNAICWKIAPLFASSVRLCIKCQVTLKCAPVNCQLQSLQVIRFFLSLF